MLQEKYEYVGRWSVLANSFCYLFNFYYNMVSGSSESLDWSKIYTRSQIKNPVSDISLHFFFCTAEGWIAGFSANFELHLNTNFSLLGSSRSTIINIAIHQLINFSFTFISFNKVGLFLINQKLTTNLQISGVGVKKMKESRFHVELERVLTATLF